MSEYVLGKKWACEYCTYSNWPASRRCTLCRAPKPPQIIEEEASPPERDIYKIAPLVTQQPPSSLTCSGSTPPAGTPTYLDPSNKWACQICTYLNWPKAVKCTQCSTPRPKAIPVMTPSVTQPLSISVNIAGSPTATTSLAGSGSRRTSPRTSPNSPEAAKALNNDKNKAMAIGTRAMKWICKACTYENWPKSLKCVLCGVLRGRTYSEWACASADYSKTGRDLESNKANSASKRLSPPLAQQSLDSVEMQQLGGATASPKTYKQLDKQPEDKNCSDHRRLRQIRNCIREADWLWLNACQGVVEGDAHAVEAYLAAGGDPARQLNADECKILNRTSAFEVGYTLVHLAIRFQREDMLTVLLTATDVVSKAKKRVPSHVAPDLAADILREISASLRQRKGDFPCYFLTDIATFALPADVEDLPIPIKTQLYDELLDRDVQKELEDDEPVINWSIELTERLGSRLYALWNRTAGDCLLDSILQASWGLMDRDNTLRRALADSLCEGAISFYPRWKEMEGLQAESLHFSLDENQWQRDWAIVLSLASQPGASLEQVHIFSLAHILRRPIIVYGIKFVKSFRGENIGLARFQGVYLPFLWEQSFCWKSPLTLGYTRGHFSALVPMEMDMDENVGAGANIDNSEDCQIIYLPLMDSEGKLLPVHFLSASEIGHEDSILREWMECCVTDGGILVAQQKLRKQPVLVRQMLDEWLDRYRRLTQMMQSSQPPTTATHNLSSDDETDDE